MLKLNFCRSFLESQPLTLLSATVSFYLLKRRREINFIQQSKTQLFINCAVICSTATMNIPFTAQYFAIF